MSVVAMAQRGSPGSQTTRALLNLRELILAGELPPGERLSELAIVDRLGVSRTPVRAALARLEAEGFLEPLPLGGYAVKIFTEREIFDAVEIRGAMEGLAARFAAERGAAGMDLAPIRAVLGELDELLAGAKPDEADFLRYVDLNARFHDALKVLAGSPTVARQIDRVNAYPFASASSFLAVQSALPAARTILTIAQHQHHCVVEAVERGEGARAEALMREHAVLAIRNLKLALGNRRALDLLPGAALIQMSA